MTHSIEFSDQGPSGKSHAPATFAEFRPLVSRHSKYWRRQPIYAAYSDRALGLGRAAQTFPHTIVRMDPLIMFAIMSNHHRFSSCLRRCLHLKLTGRIFVVHLLFCSALVLIPVRALALGQPNMSRRPQRQTASGSRISGYLRQSCTLMRRLPRRCARGP
jgi:hypothetical protein